GKAALHDIAVDAAEGPYLRQGNLVVVETLGHSFYSLNVSVLFDRGGQWPVVGINHTYREQLCGFGLARITAHTVKGTRLLEETSTGAIDPLGAVVHL